MPESREDRRHSSNPSEGETTPSEPPLGLRNPLLPASTLGQKFLSPKFLSPMGAQPLTTGNSLPIARKEMSDASLLDNSFEGSPFLGDSRSLLASEPVTVQTSLATPGSVATRASSSDLTVVQPFSETEFSLVQAFSESESPQPSSAAVSEFTEAAQPVVQTKAMQVLLTFSQVLITLYGLLVMVFVLIAAIRFQFKSQHLQLLVAQEVLIQYVQQTMQEIFFLPDKQEVY